MADTGTVNVFLVVTVVLLFFFLGIAILVIVDHKARLPGGFTSNLFSIAGIRRDPPVIAFLTTTILLAIIISLIMELGAALLASAGLLEAEPPSMLLGNLETRQQVEKVRHFHNMAPELLPLRGAKNVCFYCHGDFPHSKKPMVRTLLNMHTQFVGCMTCHTDPEQVPLTNRVLHWLNYSGLEVEGPPFGTEVDSQTGSLIDTDDYFSKIVTSVEGEKGNTLLEYPPDDPRVREFVAIQAQLTGQDRAAVKETFHELVTPEGLFCDRCHTDEEESYMPFRALGFSEHRIHDLTNLSIIGIIKKYDEFYFPDRAGGEVSEPRAGADGTADEEASLRNDPRKWWQQRFGTQPGQEPPQD